MATKLQLTAELFEQTKNDVTRNLDTYQSYLDTASRLYKYSFDDQLLIHAQRPDATAVAHLELWNSKMHRWVKSGSKGIALMRKTNGGRPHLEYVFDVSDTRPVRGAKDINLWQMKAEYETPIVERFTEMYGEVESGDFPGQLMEFAARAVGEHYREYLHDLNYDLEDSFLEELDEYNVEVKFKDAATVSAQYVLLKRCGFDPNEYLESEDFHNVFEFNTGDVVYHLGSLTNKVANEMLVEVGIISRYTDKFLSNGLEKESQIGYNKFTTLKRESDIDNINEYKEENENERINLQQSGRLSDTELGSDGRGRWTAGHTGQVRNAEGNILTGTQERTVHENAVQEHAMATPVRDRQDSTGASGYDDVTNDEVTGRDGGTESERPPIVGAESNEHQVISGGSSLQGIDLRIDNNPDIIATAPTLPPPTEQIENIAEIKAEEKTSAFSFAQISILGEETISFEVVDKLLTSGTEHLPKGDLPVIVGYMSYNTDINENADFLKNHYGIGGKGFEINGEKYSLWYDESGIHIAKGTSVRLADNKITLTWEQTAERIRNLLENGNFVADEVLETANRNYLHHVAENYALMYRDRDDDYKNEKLDSIMTRFGFTTCQPIIAEHFTDKDKLNNMIEGLKQMELDHQNTEGGVMRWRGVNPTNSLHEIKDFLNEPVIFPNAQTDFTKTEPTFMTQDEIDYLFIGSGNFVNDRKIDIYTYLTSGFDIKSKAEFLKNAHGIGGGGSYGMNTSYNAKGYEIKRGDIFTPYDKTFFNWSQLAKQFDKYIAENRYLTQKEIEHIPQYTREKLALLIERFYDYAPADMVRPFDESDNDFWGKIKHIGELIENDAFLDGVLEQMEYALANTLSDEKGYDIMQKAFDSVTAYKDGTFKVYPTKSFDRSSVSDDIDEQEQDNDEEIDITKLAKNLERKRKPVFKADDSGQLSFDSLMLSTPDPVAVALDERGITASDEFIEYAKESLEDTATPEEIADKVLEIYENDIAETSTIEVEEKPKQGTPFWQEYITQKENHPTDIVMYQLGDFFEMFNEDSKTVSEQLGLTPTTRDVGLDERVEMCGIPYHVLDENIDKLNKQGFNVTVIKLNDEKVREPVHYPTAALDYTPVELYRQHLPIVIKALSGSLSDHYIEQHKPNKAVGLNETALQIERSIHSFVNGNKQFLEAYRELPLFKELFHSDIYEQKYHNRDFDSIEKMIENGNPPSWMTDNKARSQAEKFITNEQTAIEYASLKAEYPDKVIGIQSGNLLLFYGEDAKIVAPALNTKIIERDVAMLGNTDVTGGYVSNWVAIAENMRKKGISFYLAGEKDGQYHLIKEHNAEEYIPLGIELEIEGRAFSVESVDYDADKVSLRDLQTIYPIFRSEPIAYVRSFVEDKQEKDFDLLVQKSESEQSVSRLLETVEQLATENDDKALSESLFEAFNKARQPDWQNNFQKQQRIKRALYEVLNNDSFATEDTFDLLLRFQPTSAEYFHALWTCDFDYKENDRLIAHFDEGNTDSEIIITEIDENSVWYQFVGIEQEPVSMHKDDFDKYIALGNIEKIKAKEQTLTADRTDEPPTVAEPTTPDIIFFNDFKDIERDLDYSQYKDKDTIGYNKDGVKYTVGKSGNLVYTTQTTSITPYGEVLGDAMTPEVYERFKAWKDSDNKTSVDLDFDGGSIANNPMTGTPEEAALPTFNSFDSQLKLVEQNPNFNTFLNDILTWKQFQNGDNIVGHSVVDWKKWICEMSPSQLADYVSSYKKGTLNAVDLFNSHFSRDTSPKINFAITDDDLGKGGAKEKFNRNIAAITTLKMLEEENRRATPEEQEILSQYVGWGGLSDAFNSKKDNWAKEYAQLKSLLTAEEYKSAKKSTLNAHYTSPTVIRAMYKALENMDIPRGNILEPACGVGNFFGMLPENMTDSKLYGVELDSVTGRIAKQLYQKASIQIKGFEKADYPDNFFDVALSNVPFGGYKLADRKYDKHNFLIHDYFFSKSLDKVRAGGIVAFITSKGTLDKQNSEVRKYLAQRADLLGAIRLPNTAFKANAGTEVTSDILFFQKRDHAPEVMPSWVNTAENEDGIRINQYFIDNPDMIVGKMEMINGLHGFEPACLPNTEIPLSEQLETAIQGINMPDKSLLQAVTLDEGEQEVETIEATPDVRNYSYTLVDDKLFFRENSRMKEITTNETAGKRIVGMLAIRDQVRNIIEMQLDECGDIELKAEQEKLNGLYDSYTKKYGLLSSRANKMAFEQDVSYPLLCSLENLDDEGKLKSKADIFSKRTIKQSVKITSVDTPTEALAVSIGEKACVDIGFMASLLGGSEKSQEVIDGLKGIIFKDPLSDKDDNLVGWQAADEYLSGNVREKLAIARAIAEDNPQYKINVEMLEKVQPKDLSAAEIDVRIGATWIEPKYYQQFMFELLGTPRYLQGSKIEVFYSKHTGEWNVMGKSEDKANPKGYATYGTSRRNAYQIVEESLNLRDVRIFDTVYEDGKEKRVFNAKETILAQQKQEAIGEAFKDWIWKDPERREELCKVYNTIFNSTRPREYDGSHIVFDGMTTERQLNPHQKNAVAHIMYGGNTLLAHCVGAGKTFEMIAAAMESKRLGLCQKSLFVVPNHLTEQIGGDVHTLYPGANILVATKKDFEPANRKKFCSRIATGDFDIVIIGHTQFEKIPLSAERQAAFIEKQLEEIDLAIAEAESQDGSRFTVKQLENSKAKLEAKLEKSAAAEKKDSVVIFEELGVDRLFVDEAHSFKNLLLHTKMRNVAGIGQSDAQKSTDMFMKTRYMDELTGGRGTIFSTGTPVSNSMTELYTMMRYLQYSTLERQDLLHFDSWAAAFGEKVTAIELAPEGTGFRAKTRFAKFFNLPELINMWKECADIQTADMLNLPVPKAEHITVVTKPSDFQAEMVKDLGERAEDVRNRVVEPYEDNMLKITSDGRKLALDQRLSNDMLPDDEDSKVNTCVKNALQIWEETAQTKGSQLIFCDLSTPKNDGTFNVYDDIKNKLIELSVPPEQIAFIHDANTEQQKEALFSKVRNGDVRFLLGSTGKMGAGTNCQNKLVALHHLDCPWRPADLEQREGRIVRRGNENESVKIFKYVTERTFDAYNWSLIENKQKFIGQIFTSKSPARSADDVDATALSYAEVKALATGDERIKLKMDLDIQVAKLKLMRSNHNNQKYEMEDKLRKFYPLEMKKTEERISGLTEDFKTVQTNPISEDSFAMVIQGITHTERKTAGEAIVAACKELKNPEDRIDIGTYRGFPMTLYMHEGKFKIDMKGTLTHTAELENNITGNIVRINNALEKMPETVINLTSRLERLAEEKQSAQAVVDTPFPKEGEYNDKVKQLAQLNIELDESSKSSDTERDENEPVSEEATKDKPTEKTAEKPSILQQLRDNKSRINSTEHANKHDKNKDMEAAI